MPSGPSLLPTHATLPLWSEQTPEQREVTLARLQSDLEVYARLSGVEIDSPAETPDLNQRHDQVLDGYRTVMGPALSDLLSRLDQVIPHDDSECDGIALARALITAHPNILNMNCEAGHVTGSGLIVDRSRRRVLLHLHRKLGIWLQFGGHADYEREIQDVALRECVEESGLDDLRVISPYADTSIPFDVDTHVIPEKGDRPRHYHADMRYLFETGTPEAVRSGEGESSDFWWLGFDEALAQPDTVIEPSVKRMIFKARAILA